VPTPRDNDGRVSLANLSAWISDSAIRHNEEFPDNPVPYPSLFGKHRGDFFLTVNLSDWEPHLIDWLNKSRTVVLPVRDSRRWDTAFCLGETPVTNAQYRAFVEATGASEPTGKQFRVGNLKGSHGNGQWVGPFSPWDDPSFNSPNQPVVCVSLSEARDLRDWVNSMSQGDDYGIAALPTPALWDVGAFGTPFPSRDPRLWLHQSQRIHHKANQPIGTESSEFRTNKLGLCDMIGNIWEWCLLDSPRAYATLGPSEPAVASLRGRGFLDDLSAIEPFLDPSLLPEGAETSHSDLGFRLAGLVPIDTLPMPVQERLSACEVVDGLYRSIERKHFGLRFD
jgi:hypothetical protein